MAGRSKKRKKAKASKRLPSRRAPIKRVEAQSASSPAAAHVDIFETLPDSSLEPFSVEVVGPALDSPEPAPADAHEIAAAPEISEVRVVEPEADSAASEPPPPEVPPEAAIEDAPVRPIKILLVEDGNFLRMDIQRSLIRAGYAVVTAADGEAGIETARSAQPDLILLDLLLPKLGGQEVLKILKKDPATAQIAVVVLTGLSQKNAERLQADGALAFLEKSDLGLEKGSEILLAALSAIVQRLPCARSRTRAATAASGG